MHPGTPSTVRRATVHARAWLPVLGLLFITGSCAIPAASTSPAEIAPTVRASVTPAKHSGRRHCTTCGRVVDIRRIEATDTQPASYEFTVRMNDGTFHLSPAADVGPWQVGDRIMLLGGTL
jgi:hypothetical protein